MVLLYDYYFLGRLLIYLFLAYWIFQVLVQLKWVLALRRLPSPPGFPILGHVLQLGVSPADLFDLLRSYSRKYSYYVLWALHWPALNVTAPEDIEVFLSGTKHTEKSVIYLMLAPWLNEGLLTSSGEKWHTRRKILTPAFHFNILRRFLPVFVKQGRKLVENLRNQTEQEFTEIDSHVANCALNAICETAMGTELSTEDEDFREYRKLIHKMGEISVYRTLRPWYGTKLMYFTTIHWLHLRIAEKLHNFTKKFIRQREAGFDPYETEKELDRKGKTLAMLDLLFSAKYLRGDIDDAGILEEVDTFTFEGHDTTSVALKFTLFLLANNPQIQNRVAEEIFEVLGDKTEPTCSDLTEMRYLENCIKESLRLYPSVPFISRHVSEPTEFKGVTLPKDLIVNIFIYDMHHNPQFFPDPEKFDPDRFLQENQEGKHPFAYIPFSAGPRNCIGQKFAMMELKTILALLLKEYEFLAIDTPETIRLSVDIILRTTKPIRLQIRHRTSPIKYRS